MPEGTVTLSSYATSSSKYDANHSQAHRTEDEQSELQAFEELVAEAAAKKSKPSKTNGNGKADSDKPDVSDIHSPSVQNSGEKVKESSS